LGVILLAAGAALCNDAARRYVSSRVWHMTHRFDPSVLMGRWQRLDGGYVIEISRVQPDGRLEARYFNPNPIHVARAEVRSWDRAHGFFMELQDKRYPGSTYDLAYLPKEDCLAGWYYQAAIRGNFDVQFARIGVTKPGKD
jgi:hypothetical protein